MGDHLVYQGPRICLHVSQIEVGTSHADSFDFALNSSESHDMYEQMLSCGYDSSRSTSVGRVHSRLPRVVSLITVLTTEDLEITA